MTDSKRIAGLLGPTLIAVTITEAMTADIWTTSIVPVLVYQAGMTWFVAGLSIVQAHNRWTAGWPVLITLMGWFLILGGLSRMAAPGLSQQQAQYTTVVFGLQMALLAIGIFLSFKAYGPGAKGRPES
jgi:hypothetical protein